MAQWPTCNPDYVLKILRDLKPESCANGIAFYSSYNLQWIKLNDNQKNKAQRFFNTQSEAVRVAVTNAALAADRSAAAEASQSAGHTSKHDRARLLICMCIPMLKRIGHRP